MYKKITRSKWFKTNLEPKLCRFGWFQLWLLKNKSALHRWGWFRSLREISSVDAAGTSIPWYTYSFLDAFSDRIPEDIRVFEYGSGNSTSWWAHHTEHVVAVEHHPGWYEMVLAQLPSNAKVLLRNLDDGTYVNAISEDKTPYDLVSVAGRERIACAKASLANLSTRGVIIWDNSEREKYAEGIDFLLEKGFRQLKFTGFIPIDFVPSETSVFYRDNNCLCI